MRYSDAQEALKSGPAGEAAPRPSSSYPQKLEDPVVSIPSIRPSGEPHLVRAQNKRELAQHIVDDVKAGWNPGLYNFSGIDLSGANLQGIELHKLGANALSQINFAGANLSGQDFSNLHLPKFHAPGATLNGTSFAGATMPGADLTGAKGHKINLNNADLGGASLAGAHLAGTANNTSFASIRGRGLNIAGLETNGSTKFENAEMAEAHINESQLNSVMNAKDLSGAKVAGSKGVYTVNQKAVANAKEAGIPLSEAGLGQIHPHATLGSGLPKNRPGLAANLSA